MQLVVLDPFRETLERRQLETKAAQKLSHVVSPRAPITNS